MIASGIAGIQFGSGKYNMKKGFLERNPLTINFTKSKILEEG